MDPNVVFYGNISITFPPASVKVKTLILKEKHPEDNVFFKDFKLENLSFDFIDHLSHEQTDDLNRLIQLKHKPSLQHIQNSPTLRYLLSKGLQKTTQELKTHLTTLEGKDVSTLSALLKVEKLDEYIPQKNLLKILVFVREYPYLMSMAGVLSKNRPHIKKFKASTFNIPSDLQYDMNTGDLFIKLGFLNKGEFKVVKKRLLLSSPELSMQVVAKQFNTALARHELKMLNVAKGLPHVISPLDIEVYYSPKKNKMIQLTVYPLCNMGELHDHLKSNKITKKLKLQLIAEIINAIIGLHCRGIIHRDIKPANILLHKTWDNKTQAIHAFVADLGLSCLKENDPFKRENAGSPLYMPPDIIEERGFASFATDAWAVGVTTKEFFYGALDEEEALDEFVKGCYALGDLNINPEPQNKLSVDYVIWKLMQPDETKRMSLLDALAIVEKLIEAEL